MKKLLFVSVFLCSLLVWGCRKKKPPQPQLPPETQTGAGTFGCIINGQIDTANYADNFGAYAVYQYLSFSYPYESGYFLLIHGEKRHNWYILLATDSLGVIEDSVFSLVTKKKGGAYAIYRDLTKVEGDCYTNDSTQGELTITKLDSIKQIISGTFWFDAVDTITGEKVQIRDGRFDLLYTK